MRLPLPTQTGPHKQSYYTQPKEPSLFLLSFNTAAWSSNSSSSSSSSDHQSVSPLILSFLHIFV